MRLLVTVGNALQPFDRMLRAVDGALGRYPGAFDGTCQHGTSAVRPRGLRAVVSLGREHYDDEMQLADVVVTHAGVGSVHTALRSGHTPIVFARRRACKEHVDDHQTQLATEFARDQQVLVADSENDLALILGAFLRGEHRPRGLDHQHSPAWPPAIQRAIESGRARLPARRICHLALTIAAWLAPPVDVIVIRKSAR